MTQLDYAQFTALEARVAALEAAVQALQTHQELDQAELLGPAPDLEAERKEKAEQFPRGTGRRIAS